jgi:phytoene synthase
MMSLDEHPQHPQREPSQVSRGERSMSASARVAEAYKHCEAITRARAGNFYYGIRLLPAPKRRAMCAVYAFARRVDDIGDGELESEQKRHELDQQARALQQLARATAGTLGV